MSDLKNINTTDNSGKIGNNKADRNSNLELFRIISMLLIVAHHYVVNSGLLTAGGPILSHPFSYRSLFLILFGMWGKTGINCFIMITGYFMCKSKITLKKFLKLLLEIYFYRLTFYLIFLFSGYRSFSKMDLIRSVFPVFDVTTGFISCFLLFFLCIPFLNILIQNITEKQHILLIALCTFVYVILGTIPKSVVSMNYVSWFIVIYFIAAYIRLYPKKIFDSVKISGIAALLCVIVSVCSVLFLHRFSETLSMYYFVSDSNKILAVLTGVFGFCFFKNIKLKNSRFINSVAASTFGVLLIHANSDAMRQWLWKDTLKNVAMYGSKWIYLHALLSTVGVFTVCVLIDLCRRKWLEKPFFKWYDEKFQNIKCYTDVLKIFNK